MWSYVRFVVTLHLTADLSEQRALTSPEVAESTDQYEIRSLSDDGASLGVGSIG